MTPEDRARLRVYSAWSQQIAHWDTVQISHRDLIDLLDTVDRLEAENTALRRVYKETVGRLGVRAFGAVGDGVTDDTEALQRAIDTLGRLDLGKGLYLITQPLTDKKGDPA